VSGTKTIHLRLDIKGALMNWDDRMFRGMFKTDDGTPMGGREAKARLIDLVAKGHNFLPYGDCEGFDPVANGCPGHVKPVEGGGE
jgi:hypothetical protein